MLLIRSQKIQPWIVVNISLSALIGSYPKELQTATFDNSSTCTAGVKTSSICKQFTRF